MLEDFEIKLDDINLDNEFQDLDLKNLFELENKGILTKTSQKQKSPVIMRNLKERLKQEVKEKLAHLIKPINAEIIKNYIPEKNQNTFFLMNGNCQFVDFISEFVKNVGEVKEIYLTTLSLNQHTFDSLDLILPNITKHILVSSYFLATDRENILHKMKEKNRLDKYEVGFFRNHTKLVLIKTDADFYLFTGSANLRSSGTIEQFSIYNSEELFEFNKKWITYLIDKFNFKKKYAEIKNTGQASFNFIADLDF
jgi:hypothetical protein